MNRRKTTRGMLIYLILATAMTWLCWIPTMILAARHGYRLPTIDNFIYLARSGFADTRHLLLALFFQLGVYGPLVAAIAGLAWESDPEALDSWWERLVRWRVAPRWYLIALAITVGLPLLPTFVAAVVGLGQWPFRDVGLWLPYLLPLLLVQLLTSGLGEEPGWRGYLLPRLQRRFDGDGAIWRLGLVWAFWHYPVTIFYALTPLRDVPLLAAVATILLSLAGQTISLIGMTYLYVWLFNRTDSVFLVIVFHALSNVLSAVIGGDMHSTLGLVVAAMPWLVVFVLEKTLGKEQFPGKPPETVIQ